jgi:hypothetical protein
MQVQRLSSIALVSADDPRSISYSSGSPFALKAALKELVGEVTPVGARPPTIVRRVALTLERTDGLRHPGQLARSRHSPAALLRPPTVTARSIALRARVARHECFDGAVQHKAEFELPASVPFASWEDSMTWRRVAERLLRALRPGGIDVDSLPGFLDCSTVTPLA